MSVLSCDRYGCSNVMCDRYSYTHGYICDECFSELVESEKDVDEFMTSYKPEDYRLEVKKNYYDMCNSEFPIK